MSAKTVFGWPKNSPPHFITCKISNASLFPGTGRVPRRFPKRMYRKGLIISKGNPSKLSILDVVGLLRSKLLSQQGTFISRSLWACDFVRLVVIVLSPNCRLLCVIVLMNGLYRFHGSCKCWASLYLIFFFMVLWYCRICHLLIFL